MAERLLFVTGKLAAPALRETLRRVEPPFDYDVAVLKITVAALMTTDWIAKFLEVKPATTRIMIPGMCEGDTAVLSERFGVPAEKGPKDLKELPRFFGRADVRAAFGPRDIRVFAEINGVQRLSREQIVAQACAHADAGADVIDLGLGLGSSWLDEGPAVIAELRSRGLSLSIDTLDPQAILMADAAGVDYVLSLNSSNRDLAARLRATPVLIPDTPDDAGSLDATIAHLQALGKDHLVDPIIEPIGSGFAASLGRYLDVRRRHPEAEMLMGIGNLTELTEADSTGVTALLIGFCQEVGIRNVLTTEVIGWARGAVREAVLAAQLMHYAQEQGTPPKHIDGGLVTAKDEELRAYDEDELRDLQARVTDPNFRIFADAEQITVFNAERFVQGTDISEIFGRLGVDEATHAFYLGKELMKAMIARELRKNYRQESPLDWGYLTFDEPRRARAARRHATGDTMKKLLIQLDTDPHPSPFDTIVAYDSGVDAVLSFGGVTPEAVRDLVHGAMFTRGPDDLKNTAVWVGGSDVTLGEALLAEVTATFFGPFQVSAMLDCDGCNTTAAAAVVKLLGAAALRGRRVAIVGAGPVGLRAATLLREEGCDVVVCGLPADLFEGREYRRARGLAVAERLNLEIIEPVDGGALREALDGTVAVLAAGPAGMQILPQATWSSIDSIEVVADFSAAEPLGVEGVKATDDLKEREGRRALGALAIGGTKMKVHRACVRRLFERSDLVLDAQGVYAVATELA